MSHAAIVAREYGLPAVVGTGNATSPIKTGDRVRVDGDSGTVTILRLSDSRYVVPFAELGLGDVGLVGGKCAHLGDLSPPGSRCRPGFAVTAHALDVSSRRAPDSGLPGDAAAAVRAAYAALGDEVPVAVRSSAVAEDAADASFAGVQDTYLWLRGGDEACSRGPALLGELLQRRGAHVS